MKIPKMQRKYKEKHANLLWTAFFILSYGHAISDKKT